MRYRNQPLHDLLPSPLVPEGEEPQGWTHSVRFHEVNTAFEWGMTPSQFYALGELDRAIMLKFVETRARISEYNAKLHARELEKARARGGGRRR